MRVEIILLLCIEHHLKLYETLVLMKVYLIPGKTKLCIDRYNIIYLACDYHVIKLYVTYILPRLLTTY